jgi:hypothetical protein
MARQSGNRSRWAAWMAGVLALAVLCGIVAWQFGWFERPEDPRVIEIGDMMQGMLERERERQGPGNFLTAVERVAGIGAIALKVSTLPENLRPRVMELGFDVMMQHMGDRADLYFALKTAEERQKFLDQELSQMDFMRSAFQASGRPTGERDGRPRGPGGMRGGEPPDNRFLKFVLDRTTPTERARLEEFISMIERRMDATGRSRR